MTTIERLRARLAFVQFEQDFAAGEALKDLKREEEALAEEVAWLTWACEVGEAL